MTIFIVSFRFPCKKRLAISSTSCWKKHWFLYVRLYYHFLHIRSSERCLFSLWSSLGTCKYLCTPRMIPRQHIRRPTTQRLLHANVWHADVVYKWGDHRCLPEIKSKYRSILKALERWVRTCWQIITFLVSNWCFDIYMFALFPIKAEYSKLIFSKN